jgi:DNA-binding transcriptional regulator GbsR (MarR family)
MFRIIAQERKRREVDPTLAVLKECVQLARETSPGDKHMRERLLAMLEFMESMCSLYEEVRSLPTGSLRRFAKLRGQMRRIIPGAISREAGPSAAGGRTNGEAEN